MKLFGKARPSGVILYHLGWLNENTRQQRYDRYAEHDKGNFHARRHLESIMWADRRVRLQTQHWPQALVPLRDDILRLASSIPSAT